MTHLTVEQLLELREPGVEPGQDAARAHLESCAQCQAELRLVDQRVARLRALASPRPGRDHFLEIRGRYVAERRRRRVRQAATGLGALALAASLALVVLPGGWRGEGPSLELANAPAEATELAAVMAQSQALEEALQVYDPDSRMIDGRTAAIAARLEDQLGAVDRQIELIGALDRAPERQLERIRLWRERVGLLDALVDVHLTRATYAGM